jgi:hypothetical protein
MAGIFEITPLLVQLSTRETYSPQTASMIQSRLRRTPQQVDALLSAAAEKELVERVATDSWRLTPRGSAVAARVAAKVAEAEVSGAERFGSYLEYIPTRWWPE